MGLVDDAARLAERVVAPLGRRWRHVQAVAACAVDLAPAIAANEHETLVAAAWLHDIGYAAELAVTGLHPLDGARYLHRTNWPDPIVNLVAHHSGARFEAAERGLAEELAEYPFTDTPMSDALATADLTTGPSGERFTYDERVNEILHRYGPDHVVHRTWLIARPVLAGAIARTLHRVAQSQTG